MDKTTRILFGGIVKEEYRKNISSFLSYPQDKDNSMYCRSKKWLVTGVKFMMEFADVPGADAIPGETFEWNEETGAWYFDTEVDNKDKAIELFFIIVPLLMESVEICQTKFFEDDCWHNFKLKNCDLLFYGTSA